MTNEDLTAAGFRRWAPNNGEFCTDLFQKRVTRDGKTLYFVNVYRWEFPDGNTQYELALDLYDEHGDHFRVKRSVESVGQTLEFAANVYERMGCVSDAHNND